MSSPASTSRIFTPVAVGKMKVSRMAMAPLTRFRADETTQVPKDIVVEYYEQRASPNTLIVTEGTFIALEAGGNPRAPGIWSPEQIQKWRKITSSVHAKGGLMVCQLWHLGRANDMKQPGVPNVGMSTIPIEGRKDEVHQLTEEDLLRTVGLYRQAALNAVEAGFDAVEIHGANGYLIDQALQSMSNVRDDKWGGAPVENRARFPLAVVKAVAEAVGEDCTSIRLSPWSTFQSMQEKNPYQTFGFFVKELVKQFPRLAYIHFVEPVNWGMDSFHESNLEEGIFASNDYFRAIIRGMDPEKIDLKANSTTFPEPDVQRPTVVLSAGGWKPDSGVEHCERTGDVVVFGRLFIANPDLPYRIRNGIEVNSYDRSKFYSEDDSGYTDYPYANEESKSIGVKA